MARGRTGRDGWLAIFSATREYRDVFFVFACIVLDPFPTVREATLHHPAVGSALSLRCSVPQCYPPGNVYWGESQNGPKLRPIETSERVALDYEGMIDSGHTGVIFVNIS